VRLQKCPDDFQITFHRGEVNWKTVRQKKTWERGSGRAAKEGDFGKGEETSHTFGFALCASRYCTISSWPKAVAMMSSGGLRVQMPLSV
jgi:hypothetical protein